MNNKLLAKLLVKFLFILTVSIFNNSIFAGPYLSSSIETGSFSFSSEQGENVNNYYGLSSSVITGYSFNKKWNLGLFGKVFRGSDYSYRKNLSTILSQYGIIIEMILKEGLYIGLKGGKISYALFDKSLELNRSADRMSGNSIGLILGSVHKSRKDFFWEIFFEFNHFIIHTEESSKTSKISKKGDQALLGFGWRWNKLTK